ncbi:hypothetical protein GALMADRAFT_243664 [Galerina marginata CBS 339.88]|uniref:Endosomal/vacuolar adapter protein YPT35 n=1 Tax=Galerina marginata (strain CBS 339.88) TaxID=685588 RepID=A0A067T8W3_GALM3|nr:hypothetical protein GALMADRAFT_243664 [Galerina marginata CBS 339.88]
MERESNIGGPSRLALTVGDRKRSFTGSLNTTPSVTPTNATGFSTSFTSIAAATSASTATQFYRPEPSKSHQNTDRRRRATTPPPAPVHPFANTTAKLEVLPSSSNADAIDVEEEVRLSNTPVRTPTHASKLTKPKPNPPALAPPAYRRRPSSLPPESIFSADIFLADNTGSTLSGLAPLFAQDVHIAGWSTVGDGGGKFGSGGTKSVSMGGGGAYVVYDCVITTREGTTMHVLKRYRAFEELREALKKTLPPSLLPSIPALPPKSALGRFRPAFLDSRRKLLQFFLVRVLLHPEIGGREVVRRWVLT